MVLPFVGGPGPLADDIAGPGLGLHIDLADIFADHPEADQLDAAHQADDADGAGPAGHRAAQHRPDEGPHHPDEAEDAEQHPDAGDEPDGLVGKAGDAVKGQRQHFGKGIVALAGQTLVPLVGHGIAGKAHQRHHPPQEDVHLAVVGKAVQHPAADEAVVGVVEHDVRPQQVHQVVKPLGGKALEKGVGVPAAAHPVDHLGPGQVFADHLVHGVDVVLAVAVDGDGHVRAVVPGLHQPGQHGGLVAPVAALADADVVLVLAGKLADQLPGGVPAAVVHKADPAFAAHQARRGQVLHLLQKLRRSDGQDFLLVVAGDDDPEDGFCSHDKLLSRRSGPPPGGGRRPRY